MCQEELVRLEDISRSAVSVGSALNVQHVLRRFQDDPELPLIAVTEDGRYKGSVSRRELLNLLSRPFAMELYSKKPADCLLADLKGKGVVLPPDLEVNEAAVQLLAVDPTLQTDSFPLVADGNCLGVVAVADLMMAVAEQQKELLDALGRLSSRIREEVARGAKIQQDLLPPTQFRFGPLTLGAGVTTSSEIGGDFFDYFQAGENRLGLVIADVSGHGVQSGMVTTAAKASLHTLVSLGITTPSGLLTGMNNAILATARQTLLMTCLIATLDLSAGTISVANAGHNFPFLIRASGDAPQMLETVSGFPLGFERDAQYPETTTTFAPGDCLFLYTDGVVESADASGEEFGYLRLQELLMKERCLPPHLLHKRLLESIFAFTGQRTLEDDVTTLIACHGA
ncbi:PP2C family protein-serine/threonine phosphatase [Geomonas propionica]|uniref:SpoIIE family protein phosphatase n=1 Tax=Geomonas propionica TaxID=2798582 RepID=A0ABS0YT83_9BACT|nr:SpoIIE family protein phosphatase [Geomonas propionica]MBJ6801083.1 SpoIIE family protein phosphatase [Geomonas propionica]